MRKKATLIADGWEMYRKDVIPPEAHETQLIECKRAFYAGARSVISDILSLIDPEEDPTENDLLMMDDIEEELARYANDVFQGKE